MKVSIFSSVVCLFSALASSRALPSAEADASIIEARGVYATFTPTLLVQIKEDWPTVAFGAASYGEASRVNGVHNVQTLIQIVVPAGYSGKSCRISFSNPSSSNGSQKAQVFTVGAPITTLATFAQRPYRNLYQGTLNAKFGNAAAVWDDGVPHWPCPSSATTYNYEIVPENDYDLIRFPVASFVIEAYN